MPKHKYTKLDKYVQLKKSSRLKKESVRNKFDAAAVFSDEQLKKLNDAFTNHVNNYIEGQPSIGYKVNTSNPASIGYKVNASSPNVEPSLEEEGWPPPRKKSLQTEYENPISTEEPSTQYFRKVNKLIQESINDDILKARKSSKGKASQTVKTSPAPNKKVPKIPKVNKPNLCCGEIMLDTVDEAPAIHIFDCGGEIKLWIPLGVRVDSGMPLTKLLTYGRPFCAKCHRLVGKRAVEFLAKHSDLVKSGPLVTGPRDYQEFLWYAKEKSPRVSLPGGPIKKVTIESATHQQHFGRFARLAEEVAPASPKIKKNPTVPEYPETSNERAPKKTRVVYIRGSSFPDKWVIQDSVVDGPSFYTALKKDVWSGEEVSIFRDHIQNLPRHVIGHNLDSYSNAVVSCAGLVDPGRPINSILCTSNYPQCLSAQFPVSPSMPNKGITYRQAMKLKKAKVRQTMEYKKAKVSNATEYFATEYKVNSTTDNLIRNRFTPSRREVGGSHYHGEAVNGEPSINASWEANHCRVFVLHDPETKRAIRMTEHASVNPHRWIIQDTGVSGNERHSVFVAMNQNYWSKEEAEDLANRLYLRPATRSVGGWVDEWVLERIAETGGLEVEELGKHVKDSALDTIFISSSYHRCRLTTSI